MISALIWITIGSLLTASYFVISRRQRVPTLNIEDRTLPGIIEGLPLIAGLTGGVIYPGNRVDVYEDGEFLTAMMEAINGAQKSVHFETFVWNTGELERRFVKLLCGKAREGVKVRVLVDYIGAKRAGESELLTLRQSGVELGQYHPITWLSLRRFNNRMHRKLLIVDGVHGFVFGHGISDEWMGEAQDRHHWRDTGICVEGPAVAGLQSVFSKDWINTTGRIPLDKECFPPAEPVGDVAAHLVHSEAGHIHSSVALLYMLAITCARKEIVIQNPYFTPDPTIPQLLCAMVSKGVQVHLMVPGKYTDSPFVRRAGQRLYRQLLEGGVRLYEFAPTLLHQKIVIIDGEWSHIGSTNFDARSLALNAEIAMGLVDKTVAQKLRRAFEKDLERSREVSLEEWRKRPVLQKFLDWAAYQVHDQI